MPENTGKAKLTLLEYTLDERIACVAGLAGACDSMTDDGALCVDATGAGTRVYALAVDTSLRRRTVWVDNAFRTAVGW